LGEFLWCTDTSEIFVGKGTGQAPVKVSDVPGEPAASVLGGVFSGTAPANEFVVGVDTDGSLLYERPDASDLTGLAAVAISGSAADLGSGTLPAGRLPNPGASSLGGVKSLAAAAHQFLTGIGTDGIPTSAQPGAADVSGLAASATTDTTNAANISSGTLPAGRLPNPSASTLGGVKSSAAASHQFVTSIGTDGSVAKAQPDYSDLTGTPTPRYEQVPTGTINGTDGTDGNPTFTLPDVPNPSTSARGFKNGMRIFQGVDYTLSGATITYLSGAIPVTGDSHAWDYTK
jgi:hypothetical protein